MSKKIIAVFILAIIIIGAAAFYGGMKYGQSAKQSLPNYGQFTGMHENRTGQVHGGRMGGANFISGEILSKDDKSIILKLLDGGSKIVFLSDSTQILKSAESTVSDLAVGESLSVNGTANSDGSVNAQSIQIKPDAPIALPEAQTESN